MSSRAEDEGEGKGGEGGEGQREEEEEKKEQVAQAGGETGVVAGGEGEGEGEGGGGRKESKAERRCNGDTTRDGKLYFNVNVSGFIDGGMCPLRPELRSCLLVSGLTCSQIICSFLKCL